MERDRIQYKENAETLMAVYIYIYIDTLTNKWNSLTRPVRPDRCLI